MTEQTILPTTPAVSLRSEIVGIDEQVPLLDGSRRAYVYLDNAASTPALRGVQRKVDELLEWYSSVHRGSGLKSLVSTRAYDQAHRTVGQFVGADPEEDLVIFGRNTTEAINTLADVFPFIPGDAVLTTLMEHHSNDLPWRARASMLRAGVDADGALDMQDFQRQLAKGAGKIRLVAVTGASNVTGFTPPVHEIARLAHQAGALVLVDGAQLAPHRAIDMRPHGDPEHLDFVAISGHKMYAPYGGGALVGPRTFFAATAPVYRGGGTIEVVTTEEVHWAEAPDRYEAGSPNVIGAVSLASSANILTHYGMDALAAHEKALTAHALEQMRRIDGLRIYGSDDPGRLEDRLGVISFALQGLPHGLVAAVLGFEAGIGVRDGCFCAHPYILHMLGVRGEEYETFKNEVLQHDRRHVPGLVRVSFGCYNEIAEVDYLVEWLQRIRAGKARGDYVQDKASGSFLPRNFDPTSLDKIYTL